MNIPEYIQNSRSAVIVQEQHALPQQRGGGASPTSPLHLAPVTPQQAREFLARYHYLGTKPFRSSVAFGLFGKELLGVAVYHGLLAPETAVGAFGLKRHQQGGLWELGRLALKTGYNGGVLGSYLIRRSIMLLRKQQRVRAVIAYADSSRHLGAVYQAAGFTYCGLTAPKNDFYVNGRIRERGKTRGVKGKWRPRPRKHRYIAVFDCSLRLKWPTLAYPKGCINGRSTMAERTDGAGEGAAL